MTARRSAACAVCLALSWLPACTQEAAPPSRITAESTIRPRGEYYGWLHLRLELPAHYKLENRYYLVTSWVTDGGRRAIRLEGEHGRAPGGTAKPSRCEEAVSEYVEPPVLRGSAALPDGFLQVCDQDRSIKDHQLIVVRRLRVGSDEVDRVARARGAEAWKAIT